MRKSRVVNTHHQWRRSPTVPRQPDHEWEPPLTSRRPIVPPTIWFVLCTHLELKGQSHSKHEHKSIQRKQLKQPQLDSSTRHITQSVMHKWLSKCSHWCHHWHQVCPQEKCQIQYCKIQQNTSKSFKVTTLPAYTIKQWQARYTIKIQNQQKWSVLHMSYLYI